jgi:putative transposase
MAMSDYRRWFVPGGTFFFTAVTYRRRPLFRRKLWRTVLGNAWRQVAKDRPFETVVVVLLPDHLHTLWTLPPGDDDYPTRWKAIKKQFTIDFLALGGKELPVSPSRKKRKSRGVWQRRYWEHTIEDETDLQNHADYSHFNPVKHGYVTRVRDWPHSSFHRFVAAGQYSLDWGRGVSIEIPGLDYDT